MEQITLNETADILRAHDSFLLLTHIRPDGDTIGSAAALASALRRLGKTACLYNNTGITEKFIPFSSPFTAPDGYKHSFVVSVDIADTGLFPAGWKDSVDLAIDHHPSNSGFASKTCLMPDRAACGEIVLELIKLLNGAPSQEEADLLYIAVSTDTGCFQYANTNADTFRAVTELLEAGADNPALNKRFFRTFSKARLTLEGYIYSSMRSYMDNRINIAVVTRDMISRAGATEDDMDDLASLAGRVAGNEVSVTIKETADGHSKVSLRSGAKVNSSKICAKFGGGGHAMAAGCEIPCPPDKAEAELLPLIIEALG
ncbi:MAG: bifunctional oligoribonuclease/PAP phosphatase NrnA [Oscillospiraceae bacterium]